MIKPEDLRIGDLVMVSNDNCMIPKGALCEVVAIDSERACEDKKGLADLLQTVREEWEFSHGVWCNNIEGIPLTPELLEKNGFKEEQHQKEGTSEWYDFYHYDLGINIVYEVEGNKFAAYLDGKKLREIQYAHELQHILWALGLNAELKI
jgi:hypothetical protein|nr:MAG TPA: hypothetical protein [Caudoviricetes sp.]